MKKLLGKIAIFGFGSQGQAQALNLRDSGQYVTIALREKSSHRRLAKKLGFSVVSFSEATTENDTLVMLISDMSQPEVFEKHIKPNLRPGQTLIFAHGFNIHFKTILPPKDLNVLLVSPKGGPGPMVRSYYQQKKGIVMLFAIHQDFTGNALTIAEAYAYAVGSKKKLLIPSSFQEETETNLFGEQTVLCGGVSNLILMAFETLVKAGYRPEAAYFETLHELKLVVDILYKGGFEHMRKSISQTAQWGDYSVGSEIFTKENRQKFSKILKNVQTGKFAAQWLKEYQSGLKKFSRYQNIRESHLIEKVGKKMRKQMGIE